MKLFATWICWGVCLAAGTLLEGATFSGSIDRPTIRFGESVKLTLRCEGSSPQTTQHTESPGQLDLMFLVRSDSFSIVNGIKFTSATFIYRIEPRREGEFIIPPFKVLVDGKLILSEPIRLKVVGANEKIPNDPAIGIDPGNTSQLEVELPKQEVYVGELFPISVRLMFQAAQDETIPQIRTEGIRFMLIRPRIEQSVRQIGDRLFKVLTYHNTAVASKTGKLEVVFETDLTTIDFSNNVFGARREIHLISKPVTLNVLPLPKEGQPAGFTGAVGDFNIAVAATPTNSATGDPLTLRVQIFGQGTLDDVPAPSIVEWKSFRSYPASTKLTFTDTMHRVSIKTFEQPIVPLEISIKEIPAIRFDFFNPHKKQYEMIESSPIALTLSPGTVQKNLSTPIKNPEIAPAPLFKHIRPEMGLLGQASPPLLLRPWFLFLQGLPLLACIGAWIWRRRKDYLDAHPEILRRNRVDQLTRQTLRGLRQSHASQSTDQFYGQSYSLLQEVIGERLGIEAAAISDSVIDDLKNRLSESDLASLRELFADCYRARYGHPYHLNAGRTLVALESVIRAIRAIHR